jgi:hypothetical protein
MESTSTSSSSPDPAELLASVESAVRSGRPGRLRRAVGALFEGAPRDLFRDPATSESYDVFVRARAALSSVKGWRDRQACKSILRRAGAYRI